MAKQAGLEGQWLSAVLRDKRARQRKREKDEREREEKEREREEKEREREEKEADRCHQLELIQLRSDVNAWGQPEQVNPTRGFSGAVPKLPPFNERTDDLDAYLHRFKGYAVMQGWPKELWASNLSALLKGNALEVFHRMSIDDSNDYDLHLYGLNIARRRLLKLYLYGLNIARAISVSILFILRC